MHVVEDGAPKIINLQLSRLIYHQTVSPHHYISLLLHTVRIQKVYHTSRTMFRTPVSRHVRTTTSSARLPLRSSSRQFSSSPIASQKVPFRIDSEGTGVAQTVTVQGSPHKISVDAYPSFGGKDTAPTPLAYSLTSLSSCSQVTGSLVAKDLGIKLGRWQVTVKADLGTDVLVKGEQGNANWDNVELLVRVQTDIQGDDTKFQKFADETERRCPITQLFKRSGAGWKSQWVNEPL
ncbi:hypothetical protein VTN77DRAFT_4393 [Rasamsonia byssochlamydoides]|uniref:uncharacterized protein n=1 Tax=Rasamsonia byssochlamydoides TaxID=89139 RepID=UPI0037428C59